MNNDYLAPLAAKLTINGAINLRHSHEHPDPLSLDNIHGKGRIFTGGGKWTHIAATGVENHLISLGLAIRSGRANHVRLTQLGRELAMYISEHWDDLEFRSPPKR